MDNVLSNLIGARVTFHSSVLCCAVHRTFAENLQTAMQALALITGLSIAELSQDETLKIEAYRSS